MRRATPQDAEPWIQAPALHVCFKETTGGEFRVYRASIQEGFYKV